MTQSPPPADPKPKRATRGRRRLALFVGAAVAVLALGAYAARLAVARQVLVGWLRDRGVESDAQFDAFGLTTLSGQVRIGSDADPALTADRVEVRYGLKGFWTGDPFGLEVRSVRLVRPVLKARLHEGRLSLGPLDKVVAELTAKPPRPDARQPRVTVEDGIVALQSDNGPVRIEADALLDDGRLVSLDARSAAAILRQGRTSLAIAPARLIVRTRNERFDLDLQGAVSDLPAQGFASRAATRLRLSVQGPYPDFKRQRGDGAVTARLVLDGAAVKADGALLDDGRLDATFKGRASGWINTLVLTGEARAEANAARGVLNGARVERPGLRLIARDLIWNRRSGDRVSARLELDAAALRLAQGDLKLEAIAAALEGFGDWRDGRPSLRLDGAVNARGAWTAMGPAVAEDDAETAALKRALAGFTLQAGRLGLTYDGQTTQLALTQPVLIRTNTGGTARIEALGGRPLYARDAAAFRLVTTGGGLPDARADVSRLRFTGAGAEAATDLSAKMSLGLIREGTLTTSGVLRIDGADLRFVTARCAGVSAAKLELGENDVDALSLQLCPTAAPLFTLADGGWRVRGEAKGLSATVPFLEARITDGAGTVDFQAATKSAQAAIGIETARLEDTARPLRFRPLTTRGQATLTGEVWKADLAFAEPSGLAVAQARLTHDGARNAGGVEIDTGELTFAAGGLQPASLSPLMAAIGSPAQGQARFTGGFTWSGATTSSQGRLVVRELDFESPAGPVRGLAGTVVLTNLAPLTAAPGQRLTAERIEAVVPLTEVAVELALSDKAVTVSGGSAALGGGVLRVESMEIPLDPKAATKGLLVFEGVQVKELVENSPFADRMALTAKVSGRVPFESGPAGIRVSGGELHAIEPGTLSIRREALTGVSANGSVSAEGSGPAPVATTDTFSDFAYQAMENLAFERLAAEIDSKPGGRLGVMFYIKGEHRPPKYQELRVSYLDLATKAYMKRSLPLPSGVKVDLALDTSLNLDQLLGDFDEYQRLKGSGAVQP